MQIAYWNQRVVQRDGIFAIHEVHYDNWDQPIAVTENPVAPIGESLEELMSVIEHYQKALTLPILHYTDIVR